MFGDATGLATPTGIRILTFPRSTFLMEGIALSSPATKFDVARKIMLRWATKSMKRLVREAWAV